MGQTPYEMLDLTLLVHNSIQIITHEHMSSLGVTRNEDRLARINLQIFDKYSLSLTILLILHCLLKNTRWFGALSVDSVSFKIGYVSET